MLAALLSGWRITGADLISGQGQFRQVLGPFDATCIVVGAIIGVGIFFTPSRVADLAGSARIALWAWVTGGGIALLGALTFAELGSLYPRTAGQYEILRDAYGRLTGFLYVFCNSTAIQAGAIAIIALICSRHVCTAASGGAGSTLVVMIIAVVLIVCLVGANVVGVRWGSGIQNLTTCAKVGTLLLVTVIALTMNPDDVAPRAAGRGAVDSSMFLAALVPVLFSFGGWQHALWIGGEVRNPAKTVPLAIVVGVTVVALSYGLVNWAYFELLGYEQVIAAKALAADAVEHVWPHFGKRAIAGAVALSAFGVLNAQLLSGPRLIYGLAADGNFFKVFANISPRFATPVPAIFLLGALAVVLLIAAGEDAVDRILTGVVLIDAAFFAITGSALFVLRQSRVRPAQRTRVYGYPVIPALFVLCEIAVFVGAFQDPDVRHAALIAAGWIAGAAVFYAALTFVRRGS